MTTLHVSIMKDINPIGLRSKIGVDVFTASDYKIKDTISERTAL